MILMISLATVLLLGIPGPYLAEALGGLVGTSSGVALSTLYVVVLCITAVLGRRIGADRSGTEEQELRPDDIRATGTMRGSEPLQPLLAITLVGAVAGLLAGEAEVLPGVLASATVLLGWFAGPAAGDSWGAAALSTRLTIQSDPHPDLVGTDIEEGPLPGTEDQVQHDYSWTYSNGLLGAEQQPMRYALSLVCSRTRCAEHAARGRVPGAGSDSPGCSAVLRDGSSPELRRCGGSLAKKAAEVGLPYFDCVDFVLAFVSSVVRAPLAEPDGSLGLQLPLATLTKRRGTTGDAAILAAALLRCVGVDPILVELRLNDGEHRLGIGIPGGDPFIATTDGRVQFEGRGYYYAELEGSGTWHLGEIPTHLRHRLCEVVPIPIA